MQRFDVKNPPLQVLGVQEAMRRQGLPNPRAPFPYRGGFGSVPLPNGAPGNPVYPYDENQVWNGDGSTGGGVQTQFAPPPVGTNTNPPGQSGLSLPYGEGDRDWTNPTTFSTVPINAGFNPQLPILSLNYKRNCLIIQNNSTATTPDTAPTFYIGFNSTPQIQYALSLVPGIGFIFDIITPRDSIYLTLGPFANAGLTTLVAGYVIQGTYTP